MGLFELFKGKKSPETKFSPQDFTDKLSAAPDAQLIDVRTPAEFASGYLKDAINIDFNANTFQETLGKLDLEAPLFLYCRSGNRSGKAAKIAQEMGFTEILDLDGGIIRWNNENRPIQK